VQFKLRPAWEARLARDLKLCVSKSWGQCRNGAESLPGRGDVGYSDDQEAACVPVQLEMEKAFSQ
jgi:DNA segregation ATPase FtsK/SpoIIIE-like protein